MGRRSAAIGATLLIAASRGSVIDTSTCVGAKDTQLDYCDENSEGHCVGSVHECEVLGGITGTTGCGSPQGTGCFCCRKVSYRPTCDLAGIENVVELVDACLQLVRFRAAKPRNGTCVADERDCENYFGRFEGAGTCGDSCGCCRDPGTLFPYVPTTAPTSVPSEAPSEKSKSSSSPFFANDILLVLVLAIACCVCCIVLTVIGFRASRGKGKDEKKKSCCTLCCKRETAPRNSMRRTESSRYYASDNGSGEGLVFPVDGMELWRSPQNSHAASTGTELTFVVDEYVSRY